MKTTDSRMDTKMVVKIMIVCILMALSSLVDLDSMKSGPGFGERPFIDIELIPDEAMELDRITIKFDDSYTNHLDTNPITNDASGIIVFGIQEIDDLNQLYNVKTATKHIIEQPLDKNYEWRHRLWGFHLWYDIYFESNVDIREIIMDYRSLEGVISWAEPQYKKSLTNNGGGSSRWTPDDPYLNNQWHYNNTGQYNGTQGSDVDMISAWDLEKGHSSVIVAVMDSGIQHNHPDIAANMWSGIGYNFAQNTPTISPEDHGTHVAGIVAAVTNNSLGIAGIAGGDGSGNGVRLMSCQVITSSGSNGGFAAAYIYAADNGAAISQNSWEYTSVGAYQQSVLDAIDYFNTYGGGDVMDGGLTIFAAGNSSSSGNWYPGFYSGTVAVAATNNQDIRAFYSNYGSWIDISAPGGETNQVLARGVYSTITNNSYAYKQGTSMACPHVSGAAALVVSRTSRNGIVLTNQTVKTILLDSADNHYGVNQGYVGLLGSGRLNAYEALQQTPIFDGGDGSSTDPYQVATAEHLRYIADKFLGNEYSQTHFIQTADINLGVPPWNQGEGWEPIGESSTLSFRGSYDGNDYTIEGLYINRTDDMQGLFGHTVNSGLYNIKLQNVNIVGQNYVGALVGHNVSSTIEDCVSSGSVSGGGFTGGLVGRIQDSTMRRNQSSCTVSGGWNVGGMVGQSVLSEIHQSHSEGEVNGYQFVGGLVGSNTNTPIDLSYSSSDVTGTNDYVGGLIGSNAFGFLSMSYSTGSINGFGVYVGGLVGENDSDIEECFSTGSVRGIDRVGGLIGRANHSIISDCYSTSSVQGENRVGGLIGQLYISSLHNSYAIGKVSEAALVGGLIGQDFQSFVHDSYWDIVTTGQSTSAGINGVLPAITVEMVLTESFYDQWDFNSVWALRPYTTYPYLQWQNTPGIHNFPPHGYYKTYEGRKWYWESFPVLWDRNAQGNQSGRDVLQPLTVNQEIEQVADELSYVMEWAFHEWSGPHLYFNSTRGYQLSFPSQNEYNLIVDGESGIAENIPFNESITIYSDRENWLGYFIPQSQSVFDAFGETLDSLKSIKTEYWSMYREITGTTPERSNWVIEYGYEIPYGGAILKYGKMCKVTTLDEVEVDIEDFEWNVPTFPTLGIVKSAPEFFYFEDGPDYESFFIDSIENDDDVFEIAVFAGDTCVGASLFPGGYPVELQAYTDESHLGEEISFAIHRTGQRGMTDRIKKVEVKEPESGFFTERKIYPLEQDFSIVRLGLAEQEQFSQPQIVLAQNYPNPMILNNNSRSTSTTIPFYVSEDREVTLTIYNIKGQLVKNVFSDKVNAGKHTVNWNGLNEKNQRVGSGVYFYRLRSGDDTINRKLLIVK